MITIWKYQIELKDEQVIQMPFGAEILTAQLQFGFICLWAAVESGNSPSPKIVHICGTGHQMPQGKYISTVIHGDFVWHVFDGSTT